MSENSDPLQNPPDTGGLTDIASSIPTGGISPLERVLRFLDSGMTQTFFGIIGGLTGTFLDGRYFVLLTPLIWAAIHRNKVLEGIQRPKLTIIYFFATAVTITVLLWFGIYLNRSRPGVFTPSDYASAVRDVLPGPIAAPPIPIAPRQGQQGIFADITNDRLDDLVRVDVERLSGDGDRWCGSDEGRDEATGLILAHSGHYDSDGNLTPASKQQLDAIKKSRDDARKNFDAQQRASYRDTASEVAALELEILHRLHSNEKRDLLPDEDTRDEFTRIANGTFSCQDFGNADQYLFRLEQRFTQVNLTLHRGADL